MTDKIKIDPESPIAKLAARVYNSQTLTNEQLSTILTMDLTMQPQEFIVSAGEKRQIAQYESNDYFLSSIRFYIFRKILIYW